MFGGEHPSHVACHIGIPTGEEMAEEGGIDSQTEFYGLGLPPLV
jgi:hypothetical protein